MSAHSLIGAAASHPRSAPITAIRQATAFLAPNTAVSVSAAIPLPALPKKPIVTAAWPVKVPRLRPAVAPADLVFMPNLGLR